MSTEALTFSFGQTPHSGLASYSGGATIAGVPLSDFAGLRGDKGNPLVPSPTEGTLSAANISPSQVSTQWSWAESGSSSPIEVALSDIDIRFWVPESGVQLDSSRRLLSARAKIDHAIEVTVEFPGELVEGGTKFRPLAASVGISPVDHLARSEFVAATFKAALALGGGATFSLGGVRIKFGAFEMPLREITGLLRIRETGLRLMIIGKAMGEQVEFPPRLSGEEMQTIAFVRHAIVDRSFVWPAWRFPLPMLADRETLEILEKTPAPARIAIPREMTIHLLGHVISLGTVNTVMEEAVIEDLDRVTASVASLDGHVVNAIVRSTAGRATVETPEAPTLPTEPWTEKDYSLMSLEERLVSLLADRYNALAASTLSGLSEEEKVELTASEPTFGELLLGGQEDGDGRGA